MTRLLQVNKYDKRPNFSCFFLLVEVFCHVAKLPVLKDSTLGNGSYFKISKKHPFRDFLCKLVRVCSGLKNEKEPQKSCRSTSLKHEKHFDQDTQVKTGIFHQGIVKLGTWSI